MSTNGVRASSVASSSEQSLVGASGYTFKKDGQSRNHKLKIKAAAAVAATATAMKRQRSLDVNGSKDDIAGSRSGSSSPVAPEFDEEIMANFPTGKPSEAKLETVICKHCKRPVLRRTAEKHIRDCLRSKQEKARKKKEAREAREAAARAKEKAVTKEEEEEDDEDDVKDGSKGSRKKATETGEKAKKRKADNVAAAVADEDKEPKKKKTKKEEAKPKAPKPKGPVDVEKQCGVPLPNGQLCARSLTCKSHSMGAKRGVPGRSLPYDMLLQAYQKKNQARQQKAAIDANAPLMFDDDLDGPLAGPVDSDEERDAVMTAISRGLSRPQPLATCTLFSTRRKYQLIRMKEMLSNALSGNRRGNMFGVPKNDAVSAYPGSAVADSFAVPSAITPASAAPHAGGKPASRKLSMDVT